jgi:hypothetical protein
MGNGKWEMGDGKLFKVFPISHCPLPICHSGCVFQHPASPPPVSFGQPDAGVYTPMVIPFNRQTAVIALPCSVAASLSDG